jgi:hypothetical protein
MTGDTPDSEEDWVTDREAANRTGLPASVLRTWYSKGSSSSAWNPVPTATSASSAWNRWKPAQKKQSVVLSRGDPSWADALAFRFATALAKGMAIVPGEWWEQTAARIERLATEKARLEVQNNQLRLQLAEGSDGSQTPVAETQEDSSLGRNLASLPPFDDFIEVSAGTPEDLDAAAIKVGPLHDGVGSSRSPKSRPKPKKRTQR